MAEKTKKPVDETTASGGVSRRDFIKGAAVGTVGVAAAGMLVGCENTVTEYRDIPFIPDHQDADQAARPWAFEVPPAPATVTGTDIDCELLVVGSGMAGLTTALAAKEEDPALDVLLITGASPNVIIGFMGEEARAENTHGAVSRGGSNASTWSRLMQKALEDVNIAIGPEYRDNWEDFIKREKMAASFRVNQALWQRFSQESEEAMDWLLEHIEDPRYGVQPTLEVDNYDYILKNTALAQAFVAPNTSANAYQNLTMVSTGQQPTVEAIAAEFVRLNGRLMTNFPAKRLIRGGVESGRSGRVTGVIAQDISENPRAWPNVGPFRRINASRAVVLATGDFSADREMMQKYCPLVLDLYTPSPTPPAFPGFTPPPTNIYNRGFLFGVGYFMGEGHKMGLWAGAAWQRNDPAAPMLQGSIASFGNTGSYQSLGFHEGLVFNNRGVRFHNEDINLPYSAAMLMNQPGRESFGIWNAEWYDTIVKDVYDPTAPITQTNDPEFPNGRNWFSFGRSIWHGPVTKHQVFNGFWQPNDHDTLPPPEGFGFPVEGVAGSWNGGWDREGSNMRADNLDDLYSRTWPGGAFGGASPGAQLQQVPRARLERTIERYNEVVREALTNNLPRERDFGKRASLLCEIDITRPLYFARNSPMFMTVMGGLRTDDYLRVCNDADEAIPGLFNVGHMIGDKYANLYNFMIPGHCYGGNCLTLGRWLGKAIANNHEGMLMLPQA